MIIAGIDVGAVSLPESAPWRLQRSVGISESGAVKIKKFRDAEKDIVLSLVGKSLTLRNSLYVALAAAQTTTVVITPDAHIDLGNGAGASVNAYWLGPDPSGGWMKDAHDSWTMQLNFLYSS